MKLPSDVTDWPDSLCLVVGQPSVENIVSGRESASGPAISM